MTNLNSQSKAVSKYIRTSPSKVRRVLDQIRGKNYKEANMILEFISYRCSSYILKTLKSAGSNAINNYNLDKKDLNS